MKKFNEKNPKFQCFNCSGIFTSDQWNKKTNEIYENNTASLPNDYIENNHYISSVGIEESDANLSSFKCPICESGPMANELIYVPEGLKVVVQPVRLISDGKEFFEYDIYLTEEIAPLHKLQENPIRDYSDYIENKSFFENAEEMIKNLSVKEVLNFIKKNHPELLKHIENKGLFLYPAWIPYNALI